MDVDDLAVIEGVGLVGPAGAVPPASSQTGSPARHLAMPSRLPVPDVARPVHLDRQMLLPLDALMLPDHWAPPDESRERTRRGHSNNPAKSGAEKARFSAVRADRFSPFNNQLMAEWGQGCGGALSFSTRSRCSTSCLRRRAVAGEASCAKARTRVSRSTASLKLVVSSFSNFFWCA